MRNVLELIHYYQSYYLKYLYVNFHITQSDMYLCNIVRIIKGFKKKGIINI